MPAQGYYVLCVLEDLRRVPLLGELVGDLSQPILSGGPLQTFAHRCHGHGAGSHLILHMLFVPALSGRVDFVLSLKLPLLLDLRNLFAQVLLVGSELISFDQPAEDKPWANDDFEICKVQSISLTSAIELGVVLLFFVLRSDLIPLQILLAIVVLQVVRELSVLKALEIAP